MGELADIAEDRFVSVAEFITVRFQPSTTIRMKHFPGFQ